jgi:hypothetical protein
MIRLHGSDPPLYRRTEATPRFQERHTDLAQGLSTVRYREADGYGVGVAAGNGPLRRVAEDAERLETGEEPGSSLQKLLAL